MHRLHPTWLSAALWAVRAMQRARLLARTGVIDSSQLPEPPRLDDRHRGAVLGVLRRFRATCLVRALVLQRWDASRGRLRDIVIGVSAPDGTFAAHAWLDGDSATEHTDFRELRRVRPRAVTR